MFFRQDLEIALSLFRLIYDRQPRSTSDLSFLRSLCRHEIVQKAKASMNNSSTDIQLQVQSSPSKSQSQNREMSLLKLELKATKALLNPEVASKTDKYAKAAKNKTIKLSGIGDLEALNSDLEYLEASRILSVYIDLNLKGKQQNQPSGVDVELINAAAESFVCSVAEKLDLKLQKASGIFQNYKEYYSLCGQMVRLNDII
jgi:hypothetical protein